MKFNELRWRYYYRIKVQPNNTHQKTKQMDHGRAEEKLFVFYNQISIDKLSLVAVFLHFSSFFWCCSLLAPYFVNLLFSENVHFRSRKNYLIYKTSVQLNDCLNCKQIDVQKNLTKIEKKITMNFMYSNCVTVDMNTWCTYDTNRWNEQCVGTLERDIQHERHLTWKSPSNIALKLKHYNEIVSAN